MGWLIFFIIAVAVVGGVFALRKNLRREIERYQSIRRSKKDD